MTNQILIKHTATPGKVPATTDLALGELAVNTNDGVLFFKKNLSGVDTVLQINPATINAVSSVNGNTGAVIVSPATIGAINTNQIAIANGVASLGANGLVPRSQLPALQTNLSASVLVAATSGTNIIPLDNSAPVITEGTQIASQGYVPSDPGSKMIVEGCLQVDCSASNKALVITAFRDSTCIGAISMNFLTSGKPQPFPFMFCDSSMGSSYGTSVTYSVRIGIATAGTWYVNRTITAIFNNLLTANCIRFSEYL
jgi:hypothetical protein